MRPADLRKHCKRQAFDFDLDIDLHGHCRLVIRTQSFEQLKATILKLADFLTTDQSIPATRLGLAFGIPEGK